MDKGTRYAAVAVGMFDGVHAGHRALIAHTAAIAKARGLRSVVYTFSNHPRGIFACAPQMLMTTQERIHALKALGVDEVCMEEFTADTAGLSPEDFVRLLSGRFFVKVMAAGFNYTFGREGLGTPDTLRALSGQYGFDVVVEPPVEYEGAPISSSRVRACIEAGDVAQANAMLGAPYTLFGDVVRNKRTGSKIGFPTANILPPAGKALLAAGVYATSAHIEGVWRAAVTNIGDNPTVGGDKTTIETHILDYAGDLYGAWLQVRFHARLRGEKRFNGMDELTRQIGRDAAAARKVLEIG